MAFQEHEGDALMDHYSLFFLSSSVFKWLRKGPLLIFK